MYTFCVTDEHPYVLSVRWFDPKNLNALGIRHFKIKCSPNKSKFYIYRAKQFRTMDDFIKFYSGISEIGIDFYDLIVFTKILYVKGCMFAHRSESHII